MTSAKTRSQDSLLVTHSGGARSPRIAQAGVQRDGSVEPLASLVDLHVLPEELGHSHDNVPN